MIDKLTFYGLTSSTSIYSEEQTTAQALHIKNANKVKECLLEVSELCEFIAGLGYSSENEELTIKLAKTTDTARKELTRGYRWLFGEEPLTTIELSARTTQAINKCMEAIEKTADNLAIAVNTIYNGEAEELTLLATPEVVADEIKAIKDIASCRYPTYDECSFTSLELAGRTAKHINNVIEAINLLDKATNYINLNYSSESEELTILGGK